MLKSKFFIEFKLNFIFRYALEIKNIIIFPCNQLDWTFYKTLIHSFFSQFNDTNQLFCNDTEGHKNMRKAQHPFLPLFIKLEKAVDSFDILKEKKETTSCL